MPWTNADACVTARSWSHGLARHLRGQKLGRLTVIERDGPDSHGHMIWRCRCNCGGQTFAATGALAVPVCDHALLEAPALCAAAVKYVPER
jgi:hypothetical protein